MKLKKELQSKNKEVSRIDLEHEEEIAKKNKEINSLKAQLRKKQSQIKIKENVTAPIKSEGGSIDSSYNQDFEPENKTVKSNPIKHNSKPNTKNQRITDTGSIYPTEPQNADIMSTSADKSATLPPPSKSLNELKAPMIQFRSILRISNVSIEEFLDSIIFKDKSQSKATIYTHRLIKFIAKVSFSDFKLKTEGILKNHTSDFSAYVFNGSPTKTREQLKETLGKLYFELEDYLDEKLENEIKE